MDGAAHMGAWMGLRGTWTAVLGGYHQQQGGMPGRESRG